VSDRGIIWDLPRGPAGRGQQWGLAAQLRRAEIRRTAIVPCARTWKSAHLRQRSRLFRAGSASWARRDFGTDQTVGPGARRPCPASSDKNAALALPEVAPPCRRKWPVPAAPRAGRGRLSRFRQSRGSAKAAVALAPGSVRGVQALDLLPRTAARLLAHKKPRRLGGREAKRNGAATPESRWPQGGPRVRDRHRDRSAATGFGCSARPKWRFQTDSGLMQHPGRAGDADHGHFRRPTTPTLGAAQRPGRRRFKPRRPVPCQLGPGTAGSALMSVAALGSGTSDVVDIAPRVLGRGRAARVPDGA